MRTVGTAYIDVIARLEVAQMLEDAVHGSTVVHVAIENSIAHLPRLRAVLIPADLYEVRRHIEIIGLCHADRNDRGLDTGIRDGQVRRVIDDCGNLSCSSLRDDLLG